MTNLAIPAGARNATSGTARPARTLPATPDIWFFVFFEAFLFTAYFTVYMVRRTQDVGLFLQSQAQLSLATGVVNTLILLVSSWSMARCVQAAREGSMQAALRNAFLTIGFALAFLIVKVSEWTVEIEKGFSFTTNGFFAFYYFLTAIHFIHLLIGFIFLGVVVHQLRQPVRSQPLIETGATYWHMVDFLWIMIFALLYLMR
ncbi:MAG: cytochrome c oxidase subunit 3 [Sinimarinibacterium sp.]|jgi:nitric oxide reductase NorE protein